VAWALWTGTQGKCRKGSSLRERFNSAVERGSARAFFRRGLKEIDKGDFQGALGSVEAALHMKPTLSGVITFRMLKKMEPKTPATKSEFMEYMNREIGDIDLANLFTPRKR
jgi:hypothetical protein